MAKKKKRTKSGKVKQPFRHVALPVAAIRRYKAGKPIIKGEIY